MAVAQGYGKIVTSGSVFAYDVGDTRNSYIGEPTTNVLGFDATVRTVALGNQVFDSVQFGSSATCQVVEFDGRRAVAMDRGNSSGVYYENRCYIQKSVEIGEYVSWSMWVYSPTGGQQLHIEFYGGDYNWGVSHDYNTHTGTGWERLYARTLYSATSYANVYAFIYANTDTTFYVRDLQIEKRQYPTSFTNGTRSTTQGLLDLTGNNTIDLSNVSFDSNAEMTFDGSNDYVPIPPSLLPTGQITIALVYRNDDSGRSTSVLAGGAGQQDLNIHLPWSDTNVYWDCGRPFNRIYKATTTGERTGMHYWVFTKNPTTGIMNIYLDGNLWHTGGGQTSTLPALTTVSLGCYDSGNSRAYFTAGVIPLAKIYNRALTAAEVSQNYRHYKTRFNLS